MSHVKRTAEQVIDAIKRSGGIKATIATRLGVNRHTVDNYLARWPSVEQAYRNEVETVGDQAESNIIDDIVTGKSVETSKWYAANKLRDRGYGPTSTLEVTGQGGGPITIAVVSKDNFDGI